MKPALKKLVVLITGWAFLLLGIFGLFLPILQGVLFIAIGLTILSTEYAWAHHLLQKLKKRFPSIARHIDAAKERASNFFRRHKSKANA
jgi:uncharacterized membrane protein YbaN (DUF454 family)